MVFKKDMAVKFRLLSKKNTCLINEHPSLHNSKLETDLEELDGSIHIVPVKNTISINKLSSQKRGHVPVNHWRYAPEFASLDSSVIQIESGIPKYCFPFTPSSFK